MTINLRQMAEDEIIFRFESDADKREFWELYIENYGVIDDNSSLFMLNKFNTCSLNINKRHNKIKFYLWRNELTSTTWTEIKERYKMRDNIVVKPNIGTKGIKQAVDNCTETIKQSQTHQAITLLQSLGYKVEEPYVEPTDEEICARILAENKKIGYVADTKNSDSKYYIYYDNDYNKYKYDYMKYSRLFFVMIYTTQSIASQIVAELNEKRFERRSE